MEDLNNEVEVNLEDDKKWCVYKHTNLENGKIYYGIAQNYIARWNNGAGYANNIAFWKDIVLYGWRNFKHELIFQGLSKEEALNIEGLLIQETQSYFAENGYNQNFRTIELEEISVDDESDEGYSAKKANRTRRRGRNGNPVVCMGKYYPNIKSFCEENDEDAIVVSQGLNPNCTRVLPSELVKSGLRYATEDEIKANS